MIEFAGIQFRNPFVVASSPLTAKPHLLKRAWDNGAAAASTKLTLIKQPFYKKCRMYHDPKVGSIVCVDRRMDLEEGYRLIQEGKEVAPELVLFSNITHEGADIDSWGYLAAKMEEAGADIIEPNFICPNLSLTAKKLGRFEGSGGAITGQDPELAYQVVKVLKSAVKIPVVPKLTPNVTDIGAIAKACEEGGADGLCLAGAQLSLPPVDLYNLDHVYEVSEGASYGSLGGQSCLLQGYAMVAQVAKRVNIPIVGGGGIFTWQDCAQFMLWGSSLVTACTSLMWYGFDQVPPMVAGLEKYMKEMGFASYQDMVGRALHNIRAAKDLEMIPQVPVVDTETCTGCRNCDKPGHCDAITFPEGFPVVDPEKCIGCAACVMVCPTRSLQFPIYSARPRS